MKRFRKRRSLVRMQLGDAGNTFNPALLVLRSKGYKLLREDWMDEDGNFNSRSIFRAERDVYRFAARDPLTLLGLVAIWENRGEHWQRGDEPNVWEELRDASIERFEPA